jgi:DNA segregation ATPase FtsK/SpoIIIE, S-DNA-T family
MGQDKNNFQKIVQNIQLSEISFETRYNIYILLTFASSGLLLLSIFGLAGSFGSLIAALLQQILGRGSLFLIPALLIFGLNLMKVQKLKRANWEIDFRIGWGIFILYLSTLGFLSLLNGVRTPSEVQFGGGFIGYILYPFLFSGGFIDFGPIGTGFILFILFLFGIILISGKTIGQIFQFLKKIMFNPSLIWDSIPDFFDIIDNLRGKNETPQNTYLESEGEKQLTLTSIQNNEETDLTDEEVEKQALSKLALNSKIFEVSNQEPDQNPTAKIKNTDKTEKSKYNNLKDDNWVLPKIDTLIKNSNSAKQTLASVEENKIKIKNTFASFGIEVTMGEAITGPTVSQYTFRPASGIKLSRIATLSSDLALALAAPAIRMELPIPGQSAASIEIPNKNKSMVRVRDLLETNEFQNFDSPLAIAVGQKVSGQNFIFSLAKAPHLLVAGATGAGKSVWINSMLLSLLYKYSPKNLQLILVDMKMVELNLYDNIPHLLTNVITEADKAINALKWSIVEMDRRYKLLKQYGKRNIKDYNQMVKNSSFEVEHLPYTVFVIDELADLMIQAKSEVEPIVARLTAMSRAVGIHLVLGTQRPDVNVVTGLIKTNVPTRVCFAVSSQIDSRVVLDNMGGETLLGQGDGLIKSPASLQPIRFQGANVEEEEVKNIVEFLIKQGEIHPELSNFNPDVIEPPSGSINVPGLKSKKGDISTDDLLLLYEEARSLVIDLQACSISIISGNLEIDSKLAKRIIDELEKEGVVGPELDGSTLREVLIENMIN